MSNVIVINDLETSQQLDAHAARRVVGGWLYGSSYSTGDLHKQVYGTEDPPYGRYAPLSFYSF